MPARLLAIALAGLCQTGSAVAATPSFGREVVPTLYRLGCSSGECHGSFSGKGNFRLSLFAADPDADYREVLAGFGRRLNRHDPDQSLLLLKPTGRLAHGGDVRLKTGSPEHQRLRAWIEAGARPDPADTPRVQAIRVEPAVVTCPVDGEPAVLRVLAQFDDGSERDVTHLARFESLDGSIAAVNIDGSVTGRRAGDSHILGHYAGQIACATALVPGTLPASATFPKETLIDPVDRLVVEKLKRLNIVPSGLCSDNDFLRRLYLDVIGQLPPPETVRAFVTDQDPDKRTRLIDRLLADPLHAAVWATRLCDATGADNRTMYDKSVYAFHDFFRNRFERNVPWDEFVRGVLTGTATDGRSLEELQADNARIAEYRKKQNEASKAGKKLEPEPLTDKPWRVGVGARNTLEEFSYNLKFRVQAGPRKGQIDPKPMAQHVATAFLGVRLECAECHKHPHDRWSQQDFFGFTAAFSYLDRGVPPEMREKKLTFINGTYVTDKPLEVYPDPVTGEPCPPKALGGSVIEIRAGVDPRLEVWKWMASPDNPYFARAIVNRIWAAYFGRGLIDPVDALGAANPPSHPEVLDELVRDFVAHKYDIRHLERRLLLTRTYQRGWETNASNASDERNYSHRVLRRMTAEQALDAIALVTGTPVQLDTTYIGGPGDGRTVEKAVEMPLSRLKGADSYVLKIFDKPQRTQSCDCERGVTANLSQALYLYNDAELTAKIADARGRLAKLLAEVKEDSRVLDDLYLAALTRLPTDAERQRTAEHLKAAKSRAEGFEDVFWALLNRQEFLVTH